MANRRAGQRKSANAIICDVLKHHNIIAIELCILQFSAHWFLDDIDYDSMMSQIKAVPSSRKIRKLKKTNAFWFLPTDEWSQIERFDFKSNKDLEPWTHQITSNHGRLRSLIPWCPPEPPEPSRWQPLQGLEFRATFCKKESRGNALRCLVETINIYWKKHI